MANPNKVTLREIFELLKSHKSLCWVVITIVLLLIIVLCAMTYVNQQKAIQKHQLLKENGVMVLATSYRENCGKSPLRFYQFNIDGKTYIKSIVMSCGKPLGDTIEVYYLKDKPYINLLKTDLQAGVKSYWHSVMMIIVFGGILLFLTIYKILHSYLAATKHSQNELMLRKKQ